MRTSTRPKADVKSNFPAVVDLGRPVAGDHVTLYTYKQAAKYIKIHSGTIRRMVNTGEIPQRYVTRIGGRTRSGRVFMSGDQIVALLRHWAESETPLKPPPPPIRQRKKVAKQRRADS